MADTKKCVDYIFKKMKNACYLRKILFVSVDKKLVSPHNEWYIGNVLVSAHFSSKLAHGRLHIVYALLRSYLDFKV